jgi:hypothetical protein
MVLDTGYKKGIDLPTWEWLNQFPTGNSYHGTSNVYDGSRYIYWVIQYGTTATTNSTTQLWRFDTWNEGWGFLATVTSGNQGIDIEYDSTRNLLYLLNGGALTSWQVFNLNLTNVTIAGVVCPAWTITNLTPILPVAAGVGASFTMPDDVSVAQPIDTLTDTGSNTTTVNSTSARFGPGQVGLAVRYTSGACAGQSRLITAFVNATQVTTNAFTAASAVNDTFVVELPAGAASAASVSAVTLPTTWTAAVNQYANHDIVMTSGAANGQRRRIASNTTTVVTLAATVTGNARTGAFTVSPAAGDTFKIVPSSDWLYYQPGNSGSALYKLDVVANPASTWVALASAPGGIAGAGNTMFPQSYAPSQILAIRGTGTATVYAYNIGLGTWVTLATFIGQETFNTGAAMCILGGERKLFIQKEASQRTYIMDLTTGVVDVGPFVPYAAPGAYDGKRARYVRTPDGAKFLYIMRAGGQEFFRVAVEWL